MNKKTQEEKENEINNEIKNNKDEEEEEINKNKMNSRQSSQSSLYIKHKRNQNQEYELPNDLLEKLQEYENKKKINSDVEDDDWKVHDDQIVSEEEANMIEKKNEKRNEY